MDSLQRSIFSILACATTVRKTVHRYAQWLHNCRKLLHRLHKSALACQSTDARLHPQIREATHDAFVFLTSSCDGLHELLKTDFIKKADDLDQRVTKKIDEASQRLRRLTQSVPVLYDHFISQFHRPTEYSGTNTAIDAGFASHGTYLRYFLEIRDLETQIVEFVTDLSTKIAEANTALDQSMSELNQQFIEKFGRSLTGESPGKFAVNQTEAIENAKTIAAAAFAVFNQPSFVSAALYQFVDQPSQMKLIVQTVPKSEKGISLAIDEVVDLIDCKGAEFWMVKKADGYEGLFRATCFRPFTVGTAPQRPMSIMPGTTVVPPGTVRH